jgi:hypothetical protein
MLKKQKLSTKKRIELLRYDTAMTKKNEKKSLHKTKSKINHSSLFFNQKKNYFQHFADGKNGKEIYTKKTRNLMKFSRTAITRNYKN